MSEHMNLYFDKQKLLAAVKRIDEICHTSSRDHPKGGHAYTHFMADFDEIRALTADFSK